MDMYEARQNKEKVSRWIDSCCRTGQRVKVRDVSGVLQHRPAFALPETHVPEETRQPVAQLYRWRKIYTDETMAKDDAAAIDGYIQDIGTIVDTARRIVESETGKTKSSLSLYSHTNTPGFPLAPLAGTATHQETYNIIEQLIPETYKDSGIVKIEDDHMDLQFRLPSDGYVVFDITSIQQLGHVGRRGYESREGVVAVYEIAYESIL